MKIHGFFYLVVGTGIAIISKTVDSKKFVLFVYLGIIFALYGLVKILAASLKKKTVQPPHQVPNPQGSHYTNHLVTSHHRITRDQRISIHYCRNCGNQLRYNDNFCSRCGIRVYR